MANRSDKFRKWLEKLDDRKIEKLVQLEKNARLFIHIWDLMNEADPKIIHAMARASKEIKAEYEAEN